MNTGGGMRRKGIHDMLASLTHLELSHELMDELHKDHEEVKSIFQLLMAEEGVEREALRTRLQERLVPHLKAEEYVVYPGIMDKISHKQHALERLEEHRLAAMVLRRLLSTDPDDERFMARATVLKEMIEHHIREEEDKVFPDLESKNQPELDEMFRRFIEERERVRSELTAATV
jgi:hemerythrin-like domain-containing protein